MVEPLRLTRLALAAARSIAQYWRAYLRAAMVLHLATAILVLPAIIVLLRGALAAAGLDALTEVTLTRLLTHPVSLLLLVVLAVVASVGALVSQGVFVVLAHSCTAGRAPSVRAVVAHLAAAARKVVGPQVLLFAGYAFLIVPLGGLEVGAVLSRGIDVPDFIAGELQKTTLGTVAWLIAAAGILYVNLRLLLVPTYLLTTALPLGSAFRASWRRTRPHTWRLAALFAFAWLASAIFLGGTVLVALGLTRLADALWPPAAQVVAGAAVTGVQLAVLATSGAVAALIASCLLAISAQPRGSAWVSTAPEDVTGEGTAAVGRFGRLGAALLRRGPRRSVAIAAVLALWVTGNVAFLGAVATGHPTAVIAHRGVTDAAVENTLESLAAAAELGATYVELDVQQAADGGLVVVHDTNLRRIAGVNRSVFEMTTAELMATPVSQGGRTAALPSFDAFAARAAELGVALLVELKTHGHEHGDYLGDVIAVMADHDLVETSRVQSFDLGIVEEIETRFPEVTSGWVVAFHRGRLDTGLADFVALEQSSFTPRLLAQAHGDGVEVFLWTVSDPAAMRGFMREGVDGLITGRTALALQERAGVLAETSFVQRLEDELRELVGWW